VIEETIGQLKTMITEDLGVKVGPEGIDPDAPLLEEGLKLDSLAIVELIALSEERFGIQFGEDNLTMDSFASLRALAGSIAAMRVSA
jgi:acyl carrier protein